MTRNLFEGNYVHDIMSGAILLGGNLSSTAQNNIIRNCTRGIADYYSGCSGNLFINNTIFDCTYGAQFSESSSSVSAYNNIFYNNEFDFATIAATNPTIEYNICFDSSLTSANNLSGTDALFVDYTNGAFALKSTSPAIGYGHNILTTSIDLDFFGLTRTKLDAGAVNSLFIPISISAYPDHFSSTDYSYASNPFSLTNISNETIDYTVLIDTVSA